MMIILKLEEILMQGNKKSRDFYGLINTYIFIFERERSYIIKKRDVDIRERLQMCNKFNLAQKIR